MDLNFFNLLMLHYNLLFYTPLVFCFVLFGLVGWLVGFVCLFVFFFFFLCFVFLFVCLILAVLELTW